MGNIQLETIKGIGVLTVTRPKHLNALNLETLGEIESAIDNVKLNKEIQCLIITGSGDKAFIAGADISEMYGMGVSEARDFSAFGSKVFRKIETLDIPVIAAVNGYALGGGCEMALSCDIRIASENAVFGQPEVNLGIIPGFGGTQRLARTIGLGRAKEMMYTGKSINVEEAYRIGLINKIVPKEEIVSEALKLAEIIVRKSPSAVVSCKNVTNKGYWEGINGAYKFESDIFAQCFETEDRKKHMEAFLNKK